jgi:Fe-S oxidoreductase
VDAAVKLLQAIDVEVVTIGHGQSSGFMATTLGFPETARRQAKAILAELADTGAGRLLVLNPGDYFTLRQMYDERLGIDFPADVELVEVATLLAEALADGRLALDPAEDTTPYAYVDPTHAVRVPERHDAPRALAAALFPDAPARELFWRRERAHPVGSTGLQFGRPDIAERLTRARLEDARESGAELLLCEDAATLHHLNRYAAEYGVRTANLYQLLANHLV